MQRRVESALVAKVGTFVFAGVLGLPVTLPASGGPVHVPTIVASEAVSRDSLFGAPLDPAAELADLRSALRSSTVARGITFEEPDAAAGGGTIERAPAPEPAAAPAAPPAAPAPPSPEPIVQLAPPPVGGAVVLASWYGPGFYGNRTACGLTFTPETFGVAHLTLPCGTRVTLTSPAGRTVTVPVIDRGPYVAGRTLDLSFATKSALACTDLCQVRMTVGP